jgi:ABC-type bacteriocin/lantibiotic exporter with double-glycine peptidase domain
MDIVTGLLIPDQGKIWMDGQDLGEVDRAAWYNSIAYVSQDSVFTIHH